MYRLLENVYAGLALHKVYFAVWAVVLIPTILYGFYDAHLRFLDRKACDARHGVLVLDATNRRVCVAQPNAYPLEPM